MLVCCAHVASLSQHSSIISIFRSVRLQLTEEFDRSTSRSAIRGIKSITGSVVPFAGPFGEFQAELTSAVYNWDIQLHVISTCVVAGAIARPIVINPHLRIRRSRRGTHGAAF